MSFSSTLGDDGDPLDVLILLNAPVEMGCVVTVRRALVLLDRGRAAFAASPDP